MEKQLPTYKEFLLEKKKGDFEDSIENDGYFKGLSVSTARKKAAQMKKQADMDDDDPDAYKTMPGSTKGKKLLKKSQHTKDYHEIYNKDGKNESIINEKYKMITATGLDGRDKTALMKIGADVKQKGPGWYITFNIDDKKKILDYLQKIGAEIDENVNENASGDRSPIDSDKIETALNKKSEETGIPLPLLRIIMRRGMAAWKSGHRPGAGQEQWGYARINSFATKSPGTWGKPIDNPKPKTGDAAGADADVAQEVIKGGYDKKLKKK